MNASHDAGTSTSPMSIILYYGDTAMSRTIYLYIKTHNITGLKYLGKTKQDPFKYKGSGKRWRYHIRKHGNDVTTEVIGVFETNEQLRLVSENNMNETF